jgi:hypothetical protein
LLPQADSIMAAVVMLLLVVVVVHQERPSQLPLRRRLDVMVAPFEKYLFCRTVFFVVPPVTITYRTCTKSTDAVIPVAPYTGTPFGSRKITARLLPVLHRR